MLANLTFTRSLKCKLFLNSSSNSLSNSERFVASSTDGTMTLFENDKYLKTIQLQGEEPLVRLINDEVVTVARNGKLTVLNKYLEVLKSFNGTENRVVCLTGNDKYIVFTDDTGTVWYNDGYNDTQDVSAKFKF